MPTLLIIRGYCGSGKSTVAKMAAQRLQAVFLEYDTFLWSMHLTNSPGKREYTLTWKNYLSALKNAIEMKTNIVLEGPLVPRTKDDPFDLSKLVALAKRKKYDVCIVQLVVEESEALKRMKKRNHIVPKWERDMFSEKHDSTLQKEEVILDTTDLSIRQVLNRVMKLMG